MKKILFLFIALFALTTVIYASFPISSDSNELAATNLPAQAPPPSIDWGLAAACFFVGTLGVHRFMMGDVTNGILMLLTAGGCGIWALIDFIRILSGDMYR